MFDTTLISSAKCLKKPDHELIRQLEGGLQKTTRTRVQARLSHSSDWMKFYFHRVHVAEGMLLPIWGRFFSVLQRPFSEDANRSSFETMLDCQAYRAVSSVIWSAPERGEFLHLEFGWDSIYDSVRKNLIPTDKLKICLKLINQKYHFEDQKACFLDFCEVLGIKAALVEAEIKGLHGYRFHGVDGEFGRVQSDAGVSFEYQNGDTRALPIRLWVNITSEAALWEQVSAWSEVASRTFGQPSYVTTTLNGNSELVDSMTRKAHEISPVWSSMEVDVEYAKSFDPYAARLTELPSVIPMIQYDLPMSPQGDRIAMMGHIVHTKSESFLELQTTQGTEFLQKVADAAKCEIEIWEGPPEKRWGLYE